MTTSLVPGKSPGRLGARRVVCTFGQPRDADTSTGVGAVKATDGVDASHSQRSQHSEEENAMNELAHDDNDDEQCPDSVFGQVVCSLATR